MNIFSSTFNEIASMNLTDKLLVVLSVVWLIVLLVIIFNNKKKYGKYEKQRQQLTLENEDGKSILQ